MGYRLSNLFAIEVLLIARKPSQIFQPVIFTLITITLFVIAMGGEKTILSQIAAPVIWVTVLLSVLLCSERLFHADSRDGTLEQMQIAACPFVTVISIKLLMHWVMIIVPVIIASPVYARLLYLDPGLLKPLIFTLLMGTPVLVLFSALGSALTLSLNRSSLLLGLIITPLYIPALIIAISTISAADIQQDYSGHIALLAALLLSGISVSIPAITAALRLNT